MYHRGTLAQFNTWHETANAAEGITPEGKIGFVDGKPAPNNQRTTAYSSAQANPNKVDDYVWLYGAYKSPLISVYTEYPIEFTPGYVLYKETITMVKL